MKAGVAVDNYKIPIFQEKLKAAGFTAFEALSFSKDTSVIQVETEEGRLGELTVLLRKISKEIRRAN